MMLLELFFYGLSFFCRFFQWVRNSGIYINLVLFLCHCYFFGCCIIESYTEEDKEKCERGQERKREMGRNDCKRNDNWNQGTDGLERVCVSTTATAGGKRKRG